MGQIDGGKSARRGFLAFWQGLAADIDGRSIVARSCRHIANAILADQSEAEINRIAGEIALMSHAPDPVKAEAYFERAVAIARQQQAKSWELRAAMSFPRLWRDRGKPQQARELLAPVYGWFIESFMTVDRLNDHVKRAISVSAGHLIRQRLIMEAKRLLVFTTQPIQDIHPSHFARFFRKHTGATPRDFRYRQG